MKKFYLLCLLASQVYGQIPFNTTFRYLDKNYVKARINTVNNKFWNISGNGAVSYEVPKGKLTHAQYANSIWIGGLDPGGQLHISANTYRQNGTDFWGGPLDTTNITAFTPSNSAVYNTLWKIDCDEINAFANAFNTGLIANGTYTVPPDMANYPAKGIAKFQKNLEPFFDANNNGQYLPFFEGDYPIIKGQQQVLSIYNDNYAMHGETGAPPMGLEIHERSYAYFQPNIHDSMQALNYTTFYHYTIYNRSNYNYNQVYISDWSDVDLGYYMDDYIGTDTVNNFAYCYNATNNDPTAMGVKGYGNKPPVVSHAIIKTACGSDGIDNDVDGFIDEPGESFRLNRTSYYNNNYNIFPPATINPGIAIDYYNYMNSKWKDNSDFIFGGNAYGTGTPTKFIYPGDPAANTGWTEGTAGNTMGDRRVLVTSGPINFPAHSKIEWGYAVVFSQDTLVAVNTITEFTSRVQRDVKNVVYYDETHQTPFCMPAITAPPIPNAIAKFEKAELQVMVYPNPGKSQITVDLSENVKYAELLLFDLTGKKVMQLEIKDTYRGVLEVSDLPQGVYVLQIHAADKILTEKLIKN